MEYETIYEISRFQLPWDSIISILIVIICLVKIFDSIFNLRTGDSKISNIITIIVSCIVMLGFTLCFVTSLEFDGGEKRYYSKQYYKGNYEVVEGKVQVVRKNSQHKYYCVKDVYFHSAWLDETYSYIKENGQQVRISYIPDEQVMKDGTLRKESIQIVKFEMLEEDTD